MESEIVTAKSAKVESEKLSLCQFNGGCFGCCGYSFAGKESVFADIKENTREFKEYENSNDLLGFRNRLGLNVKPSGVCPNVVFLEDGNIGCPLHPSLHSGQDYRQSYCNNTHVCETQQKFFGFDSAKKKRFLDFLRKKKLDFYDYSLGMDSGRLLREFESEEM